MSEEEFSFTSDGGIPSPFYRVSVKALTFDEDQRLLVLQEVGGNWEIPGGGWEHGETLEECVRRELDEELGARVARIHHTTLHPSAGHMRLKLAVVVDLEPGELTAGEEMQEFRWVTEHEFLDLALPPGEALLRPHILAVWPT